MATVIALTNTTNIVVNNDFWNKANQMISPYFQNIERINFPEKPGASDMELPWIYEMMQLVIPIVNEGDLVLFDGDMSNELIYNLALGAVLSARRLYGSFIAINDEESQELFRQSCNNPYTEATYVNPVVVLTYTDPKNPGNEILLSESILRILSAGSIEGKVMIQDAIASTNKTVQILLGLLYYLGIKVDYNPEYSNSFIDFIVNS